MSTTTVIVKGRISNVRWLESAPFNAVKIRNGNFFAYRLVVPTEQATRTLWERIEGFEGENKVWIETVADLDAEAKAEAVMMAKIEAETAARAATEVIFPCYNEVATWLKAKGRVVTNEACRERIAESLVAFLDRHECRLPYTQVAEIKALQRVLESGMMDWVSKSEAEIAELYTGKREWLSEIIAKYRGR